MLIFWMRVVCEGMDGWERGEKGRVMVLFLGVVPMRKYVF